MTPLLDDRARALLERERRLLARLGDLLDRAGLADDARRARDAAEGLSDAFLVVVVGEFNAGKSSVLNALFGAKLMEEGPIPTTAKITLLRHGDEPLERQLTAYLVERRVPSDLLRFLTLVDTPGTNSIVEEHQRLTEDFVPRADLVLFVTSYDRPLTATEATFLRYIRGTWGRRFVCVLNKADLARSDDDLQTVIGHVKAGIEEALGDVPEVFPVSAALGYEAKTNPSEVVRATLLPQSRFAPFERFVRETLAGPDRLAQKLAAPLDAADARLAALDGPVGARRDALTGAEGRLRTLEGHLAATRAALTDAYARPLAEIDTLLDAARSRGVQFLDDAFRVSNVGLLRDRDRFKDEFQRRVVGDLDREIEARVVDGVDAMQTRALGLWGQALAGLRTAEGEATTGAAGFDRTAALAALDREADRRLRLHDVREEARRVLENAQGTATFARTLGLGAAGLGVLGGALVVATTADALGGFGIATAGVLGIASLTFLPVQKRRATAEFTARMDALRADLHTALAAGFEAQADTVAARTRAALAPLEAEVEAARTALAALETDRTAVADEVAALRRDVAAVG